MSSVSRRSYGSNVNGLVDKEHHGKTLKEIIKLDVAALDGVGEKMKEVRRRGDFPIVFAFLFGLAWLGRGAH